VLQPSYLIARGHEVTLFETRGPDDKVNGAGLLLQPAGLAVLKQLNLLAEIIQTGARIDTLFGTNQQERVVLDLAYYKLQPFYYGMGIERHHLFNLLQQPVMAQTTPIHWRGVATH